MHAEIFLHKSLNQFMRLTHGGSLQPSPAMCVTQSLLSCALSPLPSMTTPPGSSAMERAGECGEHCVNQCPAADLAPYLAADVLRPAAVSGNRSKGTPSTTSLN